MSNATKNQVTPVVEHELALKVYIDSLLFEAVPEIETDIEPEIELPAAEVAVQLAEQSQPPQAEAAWNEVPFECLLFKVAGFLTLAVPLVRLNGILQWQGEVTNIPGHAEWFLGLLPHRGRQVKVIDIAKFVIPENHKSRQVLNHERHFKHLLLIDDGQYGLACDDLGSVLKLNPDQVRWRQERSNRPWHAGTLIEQMSGLLDLDRFGEMLKEGVPADEIR